MTRQVGVSRRRMWSGGRDRGATAAEYALLAALIAAVIATTVAALGVSVGNLFTAGLNAFP